jgi:site-specific DNA recombinase
VDVEFFDRKSTEWRGEDRLLRTIQQHQEANQTYFEEGVMLLELSRRAHALFEKQPASEKRRLLDFLLSNCKQLQATFKQPFDILAEMSQVSTKENAAGGGSDGTFENWRGGRDSNPRPPA